MRALYIQHGCEADMEVLPAYMEANAKAELNKKAHSAEALTLEDVMAALNSKEIKERSNANGDNREGLYVRGITYHRDSHQSRGIFKVMMSMSVEALFDWIIESRSSYHMKPMLDLFFDFLGMRWGVVLSGTRKDNCVYSLDGHVAAGELNASFKEKDSLAQVWRKRLGHISEAGLQVLEKQELFGKKSLGPSQVESLGGKRYFLSIVDDYSRRLRTDNGLEFCNREFKKLCIENGIARHLTVVETPQQNGLEEWMNRTLMDKIEVELQGLNNRTLEEDLTDQEDGDDEDVRDQKLIKHWISQIIKEEDTHKPLTYQEAVAWEVISKRKADMKEEMDSLRKNKTWKLVDHPVGQKLMSYKWLFKIKERTKDIQKPGYNASLVARGFTQRASIDYNKVFSLVVQHTSILVILALTECKDYELEQLDVNTTFLHGNLEKVIYMRQPPKYEQCNNVCLLKKSLYGLKQSLRK
uniref:Retrovirus-related Pol polyprotein from transposon TNT 1-94 n=1 Tax=Tanacetum cinerariifolium TaxID=118510 RepID=A0A699GXM8_TANCI|nr:retrovirus-related Pol polyprotein from transposon TNT 1-94 [Tanacetum cinerariifolium]